ncbi:alpha/beta fold hydrolase [Streptomyces hebeiensis]
MSGLPQGRELTAVSADGSRIHVEVFEPPDAGSGGGSLAGDAGAGAGGGPPDDGGRGRRPAVVLVHGWTCSLRFWAPQIRGLAADHRVIVYDQRGHGRSPLPGPGGYSTEALADDLEAVLTATLAPDEKAVLVGHSMGGMTLMAAAPRPVLRRHAAAVALCSTASSRLTAESLVLPLRPGRPRTRLTRLILGARFPLGPVTPVSKWLLRYGTMGPRCAPEAVTECARLVQACARPSRIGWAHVLDALDLDDSVRELRAPTAVLVGTADRLTPPVHARALAAALPDCVGLTELPGAGHMTPVEVPRAVTAAIRDLSTRHLGATEGAA